MTSTRPVVKFLVPKDNTSGLGMENPAPAHSYQYSSLNCENCKNETIEWYGVSLVTCGIVVLAVMGMWFARKYIFKIHETSRN